MANSLITKRTILKNGADDPITHDAGDDKGGTTPSTGTTPSAGTVVDDKGGLTSGSDDPATHDVGDDKGGLTSGSDDPATHDVGDDKGGLTSGSDDPATHDVGDDKGGLTSGSDDPATHDVGDDKGGLTSGSDDGPNHDLLDDKGHHVLKLFHNSQSKQLIFTDDSVEFEHWGSDVHKSSLDLSVTAPAASASTVAVYRFHDAASDVYYWTADDKVKDSLVQNHPEVEFHGEAFQAYRDGASGGTTPIGVVWDHSAPGQYGSFTYAVNDDAVRLAGQSSDDGLEYMGVAFWI